MNDPDMSPSDLGIRYEHVQTTAFAVTMDALYRFAFFGEQDMAAEDFADESSASWCSAILHGYLGTGFVQQWDAYLPAGARGELLRVNHVIERCLLICETAQARRVLEGLDDNFMDWAGQVEGGLSMRQVSMLSGMTEASVRTLSNPKRRNALPTVNDGKNVYVEIAAAKQWLQVKSRYVPLKRTNRAGQLDLVGRKFIDADELLYALDQRLQFMLLQPHAEQVRRQLTAISPALLEVSSADRPTLRVTQAQLDDRPFMLQVGQALELPAELLTLRAAEVSARTRLFEIERLIQHQTRLPASPAG